MIKIRKNIHTSISIIFCVILTSCLTGDPVKLPFQSYIPDNYGDGWEIAEPDDVGIDGDALKDVYKYVHDDNNLWQIRSLLVFRNGKLVAESYMKDNSDRTTPRAIWSCTKQVIGILTGIAVEEGMIKLTDKIEDHLPQVYGYPDKKDITIENLLTMKSGIGFYNDGHDGGPAVMSREEPSSSLDYIFGLKMHSSPGAKFHYNDGDPFIMSAILQARAGKATRDWAKEVLFDRIGITRLEWLNYKDGITFGGYGIKTTPRDLGKFGQLILNDGMWGTERIVKSEWLNKMLAEKVTDETGMNNLTFGYLWWYDSERKVSFTWGRGGQLVYINQVKNLIVVITGETNTNGDFNMTAYDGFSIYDRINAIAN